MKRTKIRLLLAAMASVMLLGGGFVFARPVAAAEGSTMVITPMHQRLILRPGDTYKGSINVSSPNDATADLIYSVSIGSYNQVKSADSLDDYSEVDISTKGGYNQIMDWIKIEETSGVVSPNEVNPIYFTIEVPMDAPAGGQYATIIVVNDSDYGGSNGEGFSVSSTVAIASTIYAEVAGSTRETAEITENKIPAFLTTGPLEATSMVVNTGNVHTDAEYTFQVWPLFSDEEICTNEEEVSESMVLPETRRYHTESCNIPPVGIFRAKQTVAIFGETSTVERMVIVCPIWLIVLWAGVIAIVIVWLVTFIRMRRKKAKKSKEDASKEVDRSN